MSQRLLLANQRLVDAAEDAAGRARCLQDRAVLLARLGRVEAAREELQRARGALPADTEAALDLRFDYVAAICLYFGKRFDRARAAMLAVAERARRDVADGALLAECESALALFMQREGDVRAAARYARSVLDNPAATVESRYRALLALASLHQDAYDYEEAARLYAEAEGLVHQLDDDIAMASWLHRVALTRTAHARQAAALDELDARTVAGAVDALKRSIGFTTGLPDGPDTTLDQLLLAEMYVLQDRYAEALALYDAWLPGAESAGFTHEVTVALADRGHCCLALGRDEEGHAQMQAALARVDEATPADVRAIVHADMADALRRRGEDGVAEQHELLAGMAWDTYAHEQREARRLLAADPSETLH